MAQENPWTDTKEALMIERIQERYAIDDPSAEADLREWLVARGGVLETRRHDFKQPDRPQPFTPCVRRVR